MMSHQIEKLLSKHNFYHYKKYGEYLPELKKQISQALENSQNLRINFPQKWTELDFSEIPPSFLVMDLGGMYLRLFICQFQKGKLNIAKSQKIDFYQDKTYTPPILFTDLLKHLKTFLSDQKETPQSLIFSFANALKPHFRSQGQLDGEILYWGKNHRQKGLIGCHLGAELEKVLRDSGIQDLRVDVINDSNLALLAAKGSQKLATSTIISLIVGTGTNISLGYDTPNGFQLTNLEFGNWDFLPYSDYDDQLNHQSTSPNKFRTEKLFAGAWQHQLFKIMINDARQEHLIPPSTEPDHFAELRSEQIEDLLQNTPIRNSVFATYKSLWREISMRGSTITAVTMLALIKHLTTMHPSTDKITIIPSGGVLTHSKNFYQNLRETLKTLLKLKNKHKPLAVEFHEPENLICQGALTLLALLKSKKV